MERTKYFRDVSTTGFAQVSDCGAPELGLGVGEPGIEFFWIVTFSVGTSIGTVSEITSNQ